jgi:hypothetical protein
VGVAGKSPKRLATAGNRALGAGPGGAGGSRSRSRAFLVPSSSACSPSNSAVPAPSRSGTSGGGVRRRPAPVETGLGSLGANRARWEIHFQPGSPDQCVRRYPERRGDPCQPGRRRRRPAEARPELSATISITDRALPSSAVQLRCWSRPTITRALITDMTHTCVISVMSAILVVCRPMSS